MKKTEKEKIRTEVRLTAKDLTVDGYLNYIETTIMAYGESVESISIYVDEWYKYAHAEIARVKIDGEHCIRIKTVTKGCIKNVTMIDLIKVSAIIITILL